ncbi:MAG: thioredoxin family protein, partial [Pseudomonadales bacterium]|nr:thioredoxin family protein [Pseudomonadales bacterium]
SSFMTGALAVVVASPCSAPFMGVAMGYALTQNSFETVFIFVFLGFGLAFPFLLLSYLPSLLNRLPRPGLWMVKLRKLLAYPLYLSSIWLLWVLSHQLGSKAVASVVAGCVLLFIGALLSRRPLVKLSGPSPRWILPVALVLAVVPFGSPLFSIHSLKPLSAPLNTTEWQVYSEERLEQLLAQKQPVFVNLTADWCITCLANEKNALSSDAFYQALDRKGVHYLKGDWTSYNPAITRLLSAFGRSGVPLYLLFDSEGKVVVLPQLLRESVVLEYIDSL